MAQPGPQSSAPCAVVPPPKEGDAWAKLEGKIVDFMGQHQIAWQVLEKMTREQDAFLAEVREMARAQSGVQCREAAAPHAAPEREPGAPPLNSVSAYDGRPKDVPNRRPSSLLASSAASSDSLSGSMALHGGTTCFDNDALEMVEDPNARPSARARCGSPTEAQPQVPNNPPEEPNSVNREESSFADEVFLNNNLHGFVRHSAQPVAPAEAKTSLTNLGALFHRANGSVTHSSRVRKARSVARHVLTSRFFEPIMGVIILCNAANIGWTIDRELQGQDTKAQEIIEYVLLGIFILEIFLRFFVLGWQCMKHAWNVFDSILISLTLLSMMINEIMLSAASSQNLFVQIMQQMLILRMLRLLRLARAVRLVSMCRSLWKLVQGLKQCLGTMVSAFVIMFLSIFFFACFGAEFITKVFYDDPEIGPIVRIHFSSMPKIMLTLVQFISLDSVAGFYVPIIERSPPLALYFGLLLVLVSIALMNLVTALLVEDAISTTKMDNEMLAHFTRSRLQKLRPAFVQFFQSLDASGDGVVNIKEVVAAIKDGLQIPLELQDMINPSRMLDLFDAIDQDRSGDLTETEFVEGLGCVALSEVPLETMQILHHLRILRRELSSTKREIKHNRASTPEDATRSLSRPSPLAPRSPRVPPLEAGRSTPATQAALLMLRGQNDILSV